MIDLQKIPLFLALAAMSLGVTVLPALAADPYPGPVKAAVESGLKFEKSFKASGNLNGWILSQGPKNLTILYTSQDGEVAVAGTMFDAKGVNLNEVYLEKYGPKPDFELLWKEVESAAWVAEGPGNQDAKSTIYVFEDANCSFCHLTWKALVPYAKAGLQIRWIPVAVLGGDSLPKATALLSAKDGNAAMAERHANFGKKSGLAALPSAPALRAKVQANAKLMERWGFGGTPAIIYRDKSGTVRSKAGMPRLSELSAITGLPEQANLDESLARFR